MNISAATSIRLSSALVSSLYYGAKKIWPLSNWQQLGQNILGLLSNSQLGYSVAMSGDGTRVAVSAPFSQNGLVYILDWDATENDWKTPNWQIIGFTHQAQGGQLFTVQNSQAATNTQFGTSLALSRDGSTVAVGSGSGVVVAFRQNGSNWQQIGTPIFQLTGNPSTGQAQFGKSISLNSDGSRLAVGAPDGSGYSGYVRVYEFNGTDWAQMGATIPSSTSGDKTGTSVALNDTGSRLVIGARYGSSSSRGKTQVLSWNAGAWQIEYSIDGSAANDESGYSVAMNALGDYIAIGARYYDLPGANAGQVRVFTYINNIVVQVGGDILGVAANDLSGGSISINAAGDMLVIGSELADSTGKNNCGHARVFKFTPGIDIDLNTRLRTGIWSQVGTAQAGLAADDAFFSVAINSTGNRIIVGGKYNDTNATNAGIARIFQLTE